jgi:hypothetical protein
MRPPCARPFTRIPNRTTTPATHPLTFEVRLQVVRCIVLCGYRRLDSGTPGWQREQNFSVRFDQGI